MQYKRLIAEKIRHLSRTFPAVVLTGARQVGKTTLLRELFPNYHYVSLDLPSVAEAAEKEPAAFLAQYPAPLLIDEIQYAPQLFRWLKVKIDEDRHKMGQFILTGSQKFPLMKEVADSLAGRAGILSLEALSLEEVGTQLQWDKVLLRGFYPELWRQPELKSADFYASYVSSYLERDVRQLLNISSLRDFERFLRLVAARSGQLLNRSDLARDVGVAPKTIGEWISVLEASNQIVLLEPYFENLGKRIVKSPKLYLTDPGLMCFLLDLDQESLPRSSLIGAIWETLVYSELRKRAAYSSQGAQSLWFYRDAQGHEIDFLRAHQGVLDFIECKWTESPQDRWAQLLVATAQSLKNSQVYRPGKNFIICRTTHFYSLNEVQIINPNQPLASE